MFFSRHWEVSSGFQYVVENTVQIWEIGIFALSPICVDAYLIIYKVADLSLPSAHFKCWPLLQIACSGLRYCTEFLNRKCDNVWVNYSSSAFRTLATDLWNYPRMKTHWKTQLWNFSPNRSHPSLSKRNNVFKLSVFFYPSHGFMLGYQHCFSARYRNWK